MLWPSHLEHLANRVQTTWFAQPDPEHPTGELSDSSRRRFIRNDNSTSLRARTLELPRLQGRTERNGRVSTLFSTVTFRRPFQTSLAANGETNPMIFLLDNYDSFTYNLVQRIGEIDSSADIHVARNDQVTLADVEALQPERIIISPGPCTPAEAGMSCEIIRHFGPKLPVLGVCLGHQSLAKVYGADVVRADRLMHGKTSEIHHNNQGVFANLPNPFTATRYHSLIVPQESLPDDLEVTAWVDEPGYGFEIMGLQHRNLPVHGVQFHPESFLTEDGYSLLKNFLQIPH